MAALIVIALVAAAITKTITNYRVDREYARQGLDSPRYRLKLAKATAAGQSAKAAEVARPGARGYFRELWNDAWDDAIERHRRARKAKKEAKKTGAKQPTMRERAADWWRWAVTPIGESEGDAQPAAERPVAPGVESTTEQRPTGMRIVCPECGAILTRVGEQWHHPAGSTCRVYNVTNAQIESVLHDDRTYTVESDPGRTVTCPVCKRVHLATVKAMVNGQPACPYCAADATRRYVNSTAAPKRPTTSTTTSEGEPKMTTTQVDLVDYNQAVAGHEKALTKLREQLAEAVQFRTHLEKAAVAVEHMDAARSDVAANLAPLAEGMEGARYDADSLQGAATAATTMTAGTIATVQEQIEAATEQNNTWIAELEAAIESVQSSLHNIKARYGEAAAVVQETGIDARALEEH